jgi:hypothetical protein
MAMGFFPWLAARCKTARPRYAWLCNVWNLLSCAPQQAVLGIFAAGCWQLVGQRIAFFIHRGVPEMPLINLVVALIVVGMALWLVNRYIPMASSIKTILNVVVVVAVGVFVLKSAGLWGDVTNFRIGH